ncbi:MAG: LacI family DNA-binding transcriptional regulator [Tepidisphaeraceae bacterium]
MQAPVARRRGKSIADVAKSAGVSPATVSRVINKRQGVSPEIVRAVREAMATLGYQPPPLDRRPGRRVVLPGKETPRTIAVVLLDELYSHTPGVFAAHLRGIELEAAEHGRAVMVAHLTRPGKLSPVLSGKQIEGFILMGSRAAPGLLHSLERFPSLWMSSHHGPGGDSVLAGNQQIAQLAADYLLRRGHRQLAFLAVMSSYPAYPARAQAFQFFANNAGATVNVFMDSVPASEEFEFPGMPELTKRVNALVDQLIATSPRPTGLFVPNDMITALAYVALRARGVLPGRDVDVISCNNERSYLLGLDPRPATIDIGSEIIGRRTVEQLLRKIRRPEETRQVQIAISPVLIEPGSW